MPKLFISHGSLDKPIARQLRQALANAGIEAWIDEHELRGGDDLPDEIAQAIEAAKAFLLLVSRNAFESDWVNDELALAASPWPSASNCSPTRPPPPRPSCASWPPIPSSRTPCAHSSPPSSP